MVSKGKAESVVMVLEGTGEGGRWWVMKHKIYFCQLSC